MLFDALGWPWPKHDCRGSSEIGESGLSGWAAVDVLRAMGVPIDARVMQRAFPTATSGRKSTTPTPDPIIAVQPRAGEQIPLLAMIRELFTDTSRTKRLNTLGVIGSVLLRLPHGPLWQTTLVVNSERPNLSYTCILPEQIELPKTQ